MRKGPCHTAPGCLRRIKPLGQPLGFAYLLARLLHDARRVHRDGGAFGDGRATAGRDGPLGRQATLYLLL